MPKYKRRPELLTLVTSYEDCPVDISKDDYLKITEGFMKFIASKVVSSKEVNLPASMGKLAVVGKKTKFEVQEDGFIKGLAPDWKKTIALWSEDAEAKMNKQVIYHFNDHTRGIRYKFTWFKKNIPLRIKSLMVFKPARVNTRAVWKNILNGIEYIIVNNKDYGNTEISKQ